jgi:hypothetical protein
VGAFLQKERQRSTEAQHSPKQHHYQETVAYAQILLSAAHREPDDEPETEGEDKGVEKTDQRPVICP